jgi:hypothetical protein
MTRRVTITEAELVLFCHAALPRREVLGHLQEQVTVAERCGASSGMFKTGG